MGKLVGNGKGAQIAKEALIVEMEKRQDKYPQYVGYYRDPELKLAVCITGVEGKAGIIHRGELVLVRMEADSLSLLPRLVVCYLYQALGEDTVYHMSVDDFSKFYLLEG